MDAAAGAIAADGTLAATIADSISATIGGIGGGGGGIGASHHLWYANKAMGTKSVLVNYVTEWCEEYDLILGCYIVANKYLRYQIY